MQGHLELHDDMRDFLSDVRFACIALRVDGRCAVVIKARDSDDAKLLADPKLRIEVSAEFGQLSQSLVLALVLRVGSDSHPPSLLYVEVAQPWDRVLAQPLTDQNSLDVFVLGEQLETLNMKMCSWGGHQRQKVLLFLQEAQAAFPTIPEALAPFTRVSRVFQARWVR